MRKFSLLFWCLALISTHVYCQAVNDTIRNFPKKLTDTLLQFDAQKGEVYYLAPGNKRNSNNKTKINGYIIKEKLHVDSTKLDHILDILTDSANFINNGITKSCAFEPQFYLEILDPCDNKIHIVISFSCQQVAIVTADFKRILSFGDFSKKGISFFSELPK